MGTVAMISDPGRATILVVDDHQGPRDLLALDLRPSYEVLTAATAKRAMQDLRAHRIDLVIQDVGLPDMDGLKLLQETKALHPQLPIILISGGGTVCSVDEAMQFGAAAYLLKPFNLEEIRILIAEILSTLGMG